MRIVEDRRPGKPEVVVEETRYVESDARLIQRLLGREVGGKQNILVLNDEAHHAYRIRARGGRDAEEDAEWLDEERADELAYEATVWIDGLDRIHKHRRINFCVDLSATPYYLARAGDDTNRIFPWVVSDFGLTDAIESGLVKIPQLAPLIRPARSRRLLQHLALDHAQAHRRRARRQAREPEAGGDAEVRGAPDPAARASVGRDAQGVGEERRGRGRRSSSSSARTRSSPA